ncbi:MAG: hypothetical protein ACHQK8_02170 [Bacteroidia bacterium]
MIRFSKISNLAAATALLFVMKMFFFSAYFVFAGTENIPKNIYEYSHIQYSSCEKLKRNRELNLDEWLKANEQIELVKLFPGDNSYDSPNYLSPCFLSFANVINTFNSGNLTRPENITALLNNRTFLRYHKLIL